MLDARLAMGLGVLLAASGCALTRTPLTAVDGGPSGSDAPLDPDAGCAPSGPEVCNEADDDCDGTIDEGFDLDGDPTNCGTCGRVCEAGPRATPGCSAGICELSCTSADFADCNAVAADGCETDLSAAGTCGSCTNDCTSTATPLCMLDTTGRFGCVAACSAPTELCGASCVDTSSHVSHCGGCDMPCATRPRTTVTCESGTCTYACAATFDDCNAVAADGCETSLLTSSNCGSCATRCARANATASCATGTCVLVSCAATHGNCDGDATNGCEAPLDTVTNCGVCGGACSFAHAAATCGPTGCAMGACDPGWRDCDGLGATGCETDLTSTATCGSCTVACLTGETCTATGCVDPTAILEVGSGVAFSCALLADGRVFCWGADGVGQLGNGAAGASATAVAVTGITDAVAIAVGDAHACAVRAGGSVACWGENGRRQVGDGTTTDRDAPALAVAGVTNAVAIAAGTDHTCALSRGGVVSCWGRDNVGQLGDGTIGGDRSTAMAVTLPAQAVDLDAGGNHTCAVLDDGSVRCWGENGARELGDDTTTDSGTPVRAGTIADAVAVATGSDFTCAVRSGGTAACWGSNDQGQLGDGTTTGRGTIAPVMSLAGAVDATCGLEHCCAWTAAGALSCWGNNGNGRLGDGTTTQRLVATAIPDAGAVEHADAGDVHTCAARTTGEAVCWGGNGGDQLGDGSGTDQPRAVAVSGLP